MRWLKYARSCLINLSYNKTYKLSWNSAVTVITYIPNYDVYIPFCEIDENNSVFGGE